ncbi:MAG: class I SAM-dependent methyltransferase [Saprospiraceae bacterium]|jgi:SAM-dependent methyltransferase|nr:class I SAM-dependent methyltransferase [Saprospiraceae bacterium]
MNQFIEANRHAWDIRLEAHKNSDFYDVEGWKNGKTSLTDIELHELGDVSGKKLLHLQCHFGQDTLSWARLGAKVTGCDFSTESIAYARQLAHEAGLKARFVCCNVYDLPQHLKGKYDIVFTSFGVIGWLPDLEPWAAVIAHFLKKGGVFYLAEFHPVVWMLDDKMEFIKYAYHNDGVIESEMTGTYADRYADLKYKEYGWNHSLGEVLNALLRHGLQLEFFNEYPYSPFDCFDKTVRGADGNYRIQGLEGKIPMVYSLRAVKR